MKLQILLCLSIASVLAACGREFGMRLESGEVLVFENVQEIRREALSGDQLHSLSLWFEQHRSGWRGVITPASSEPAPLQLNLKHTDGKSSFVSLVVQADGHRYLRLTRSDKWAYRSAGGLFKSWAAARPISDHEFDDLQDLLRKKG